MDYASIALAIIALGALGLCAFIHLRWSRQMSEFTRIAMAERVRYLVGMEQEAARTARRSLQEDDDDFPTSVAMGGNRTLPDEVDG